ncbi:MAG: polysaccharide lyase 6 family protein, partial [Verrucomicrobiae bacterium]|nr:polysaccharide lyase 6 family protein [Verrucomicrobiae bacterium]
ACLIEDSRYCRFTRNHVRVREIPESEPQARRMHWIRITGEDTHHNRIDHNLLEEKQNGGVMIYTAGSGEETGNQAARYNRIDHNHFRNFHRGQGNGFETIRLGTSTYSHSSAYTIIEYNLFERCNGEAEIISIKTCNNTIRHNTFRNSRGMLTLRNTHDCLVEGNYFFNDGSEQDSSGVRFYGQGHVIINNYFEGLGEAAVIIRTGDIERRTEPKWKYEAKGSGLGDYGDYQRPEKTLIAFNTIVNCEVAFDLGGSEELVNRYPLPARDITVANNLVLSDRKQVNRDLGHWERFAFEGNLFFSTASEASLGWNLPAESFRWTDPRLERRDGLMVPESDSPVRDTASGNYPLVTRDIQGQTRPAKKDVGADEISKDKQVFMPLNSRDVGPQAL